MFKLFLSALLLIGIVLSSNLELGGLAFFLALALAYLTLPPLIKFIKRSMAEQRELQESGAVKEAEDILKQTREDNSVDK